MTLLAIALANFEQNLVKDQDLIILFCYVSSSDTGPLVS
jgi:hypothetical protein